MEKWTTTTLGNVLSLKRGHDLPTHKRVQGKYPVYSSSGITGVHNKSISEKEGVITGRYGTIGQVFYTKVPYWPLNTTLYVDDFKGNHPKYIYYLLKTIDWREYLIASAVPGINRNHVHQAVIKFPDVETQKKIADFLSLFDDKIETIEQINNHLTVA
jgi:type I restriction enzyme S subunit